MTEISRKNLRLGKKKETAAIVKDSHYGNITCSPI